MRGVGCGGMIEWVGASVVGWVGESLTRIATRVIGI